MNGSLPQLHKARSPGTSHVAKKSETYVAVMIFLMGGAAGTAGAPPTAPQAVATVAHDVTEKTQSTK